MTAGARIRRLGWRPVLVLLALAWLAAGLVGTYRYLRTYNDTRGFPQLTRAAGVPPGHLEWVHFHSAALHGAADYLVYLPTGYDPARHYPVLYLLHGMPGRPQVYVKVANAQIRLDNLISRHRMPPMILVFPDGRVGGSTFSDSEWANTATGNYESYVLDVMHNVDHRFSTIANRYGRVIGGYSAGTLGALNIALHHLRDFAYVQTWSGPYSENRTGVFATATPAQLLHYSPIDYVSGMGQALAAHPLWAFLYGGRHDFDSRNIAVMAARLASAGAHVRYARYPGGHDWQLWNGHLNQMLILAGRDVSRRPPARSAPHRRRRSHHPATAHRARGHVPTARSAGRVRHHRRHGRRRAGSFAPARGALRARLVPARATLRAQLVPLKLSLGLALALLSAAAINLGFLLQQRGLLEASPAGAGAWRHVRRALRSRVWLAGQALGWAGFAAQVAAVAIAPLSLVQAFAAGGLALSVPLAAGGFGHRISRSQAIAVLVIAAALASLPLGLHAGSEHLRGGVLLAALGALGLVALALALGSGSGSGAVRRAVAAGLAYGIADAAIKAISVRWSAAGAGALLSVWSVAAALGTLGGFLAFQAALSSGSAVGSISLMNAFATLVALGCGAAAFGESLGAGGALVALHVLAVGLVLACVPALAAAQAELAEDARHGAAAGAGGRDRAPGGRDGRGRSPAGAPAALRAAR